MDTDEIVAIMRRLLETDDIEAADNFFEVGGNSILALDVIAEIRRRSGTEIPLIDFVYGPTAEDLVEFLGKAERDG